MPADDTRPRSNTGPAGAASRAGYMLAPATRLLWRAPDAVHLELGARGVVVEGLPVQLVRLLATRRPAAAPARVGTEARTALLALSESGFLWPRPVIVEQLPDPDGSPDAPPAGEFVDRAADARLTPPAPRLGSELTALTTRHGPRAVEVLHARRDASVHICGAGRTAAHLAAVLAAAGVGRVHCAMTGTVKLSHALPGGILTADEGHDLAAAAEAAILRAAPGTATEPVGVDERPDLTVLTDEVPVSDERREALHASGAAHLAVDLGVGGGVVGPLVLPGLTSCLRCADLHRQDRDPAWPALAVQLTVTPRYGVASEVALASVIAGVAALQVLAFLDGDEPSVIDGTVEMAPPDWRLRRRTRPPHPHCGCMAP